MRRILLALLALATCAPNSLNARGTQPQAIYTFVVPFGAACEVRGPVDGVWYGGCWVEFVPRFGAPQRLPIGYLDPALPDLARGLDMCETVRLAPLRNPERVRLCNETGCSPFIDVKAPRSLAAAGCNFARGAGWSE